jgi:3-mercaptopyruvate sulfurtransferase SseA
MRFVILTLVAFFIAIGGLIACNSNEAIGSQTSKTTATPNKPPPPPADNARRITAAELHAVWEKGEVVIVDTRAEKDYKIEHIKGSISMPTGTVLARVDELPRNKMIAFYCT